MNQWGSIKDDMKQSSWMRLQPNYRQYCMTVDRLARNLEEGTPGYLRSNLLEFGLLLPRGSEARVDLVLDTNVLFKQVLGHLKGRVSPLVSMVESGFLMLFAPAEIEHEIREKIRQKISANKREEAERYARDILSHVTLVPNLKRVVRRRAEQLVGWRDPGDVAFLAVTLQKDTHGILTYDDDLSGLSGVRVWKMGELGEIVTGLHRGSFSIWVFSAALPTAFVVLASLVSLVLEVIVTAGHLVSMATSALLGSISKLVGGIPPELMVLGFGLGILALALSDKLRQALSQGGRAAIAWLLDFGKRIVDTVEQFATILWNTIVVLVGYVPRVAEALAYMVHDVLDLVEALQQLESTRATPKESIPAEDFDGLMTRFDRILRGWPHSSAPLRRRGKPKEMGPPPSTARSATKPKKG